MAASGSASDPDRTTVDIRRVEASGVGVGVRRGGHRFEVPGTLVGETVRARVVHRGRRTTFGTLEEIVRSSAQRVEPDCPHFLTCGGCQLLHATVAHQQELKRGWVASALGLRSEDVDPVVPSPESFGYRAFAKFVVSPEGVLGSYRPRTHDVQDMTGCRVHAPAIEDVADALRAAFAERSPPDGLRYVLVRASRMEQASLVTLVTRTPEVDVSGCLAVLRDVASVRAVHQHVNSTSGDALWGEGAVLTCFERGALSEKVGPIRQDLLSGAFSQVNPAGAARLYAHVQAQLLRVGRVADLYAGSGGIAQTLLHGGAERVIAVESTRSAVDALRRAATRWVSGTASRLEVRAGTVTEHRSTVAEVDAVVVNPPRKGLEPALVQALVERGPDRLVYVSCEPRTLARDLAELRPTYRVERTTPFDLFPQTRHVETVVTARRGHEARLAARTFRAR